MAHYPSIPKPKKARRNPTVELPPLVEDGCTRNSGEYLEIAVSQIPCAVHIPLIENELQD